MRQTHVLVIVALLCVGGWVAVAQAQDQGVVKDKSQGQFQSDMEGGTGHMPLITSPDEKLIEGQVINYKTVDMQTEKNHRVVELKLKDGRTVEVDLGIKSNLPSGFDINKGQWVLVSGVQGHMGNESVFVAHRWANVYNIGTGGGTPSSPKESLPGQEKSGQGGSKSDNKSDNDYNAHYRDYPGHVGQSGPGASDQNKSDQNKD